jgi:hypothetical protein
MKTPITPWIIGAVALIVFWLLPSNETIMKMGASARIIAPQSPPTPNPAIPDLKLAAEALEDLKRVSADHPEVVEAK